MMINGTTNRPCLCRYLLAITIALQILVLLSEFSLNNRNQRPQFNVYDMIKQYNYDSSHNNSKARFHGQTTQFNDNNPSSSSIIPRCPVVPDDLDGPIKVNKTYIPTIIELESKFGSWLQPGGAYSPPNCVSQSVVAVIVPFRDRAQHLLQFLAHMHPFLKKQQLDYMIYVIEQVGARAFNRASLLNIGFIEALKYRPFQCFILHDVDLLPEDDRNIYNCPEQPRHMSVAIDVYEYKYVTEILFGGVCAITREQFITVNGYSNNFWGWGGEDDDMGYRILHHNFYITTYPIEIARYAMLQHRRQKVNPKRFENLNDSPKKFYTDGLNSLHYTLKSIKYNLLYTWILVELRRNNSGTNYFTLNYSDKIKREVT